MSPRLIILTAAAFLVGGAVALGFFALSSGPAPKPQVVSGKALIGGPFTLTDHNGRRVTEKDFSGKHILVFFGYTFCPDICPAELQVMSAALDALGGKAKEVTPVFITVDPKRDTVEQMKSYVENFHPSLVGLTGSAEEIR
ncbi:MAG: SCO family protein, partial [Hyphomicrobiaceae bacterium]|nr:SCO family protein [Hyphomicrobiaceae bacterium]